MCSLFTVVVRADFVCISDDLCHDGHAVQAFVLRINDILQERGVDIERMVQFTDGCSAQYKSKLPFADISASQSDFWLPHRATFFWE